MQAPPIARPRLSARLAAALDTGHVLVVGPAGSGKTTAVRQALAERPGPVAWHPCQESDRGGGRLLLGLLRVVRAAVPGVADVLADELERAGTAVAPDLTAAALRDDVERLLVEPLVLVIDDAERLGDDPGALAVLAALLAGPGRRLRVVLCARRRPAVRLAKLEATGLLRAFGQADLVFDDAECAEVLARTLGREPSEPEVAAVMEATGGWALGIALGGRGGGELAGFVAEEVLGPLPPAERATVLDTAAIDPLTPAVAQAIGVDAATLGALEAHGLGPGGAPGTRGWHPLLGEALRERWRAERPEAARRDLLARAARGLLADGRHAEAIDALLRAGREEEALAALVPALPRMVRLAPGTVAGWLAALSPGVRGAPAARLAEGQLAIGGGRHGDAIAPLRDAMRGLRAGGDQDGADQALALLLESLYWAGRLDDLEAAAAPVLEPERLTGRPFALLAAVWAASARGGRGDLAGMRDLGRRVDAHPDAGLARPRLALLELYAEMPTGRHDAALARLAAALAGLREEDRPHARPEHFLSFTAFLLVDSGRAAAAQGLTARVRAEAERSGLTAFLGLLAAVMDAWVAVHTEDWDTAELALAGLAGREPDVWGVALAHAARATLEAARGRPASASESAELALARAADAPVQWRVMTALAAVPVLGAAGDRARAHEVCAAALRDVTGTLGAGPGRYARARLLAQRAWLHDLDGDGDAAARDAAQALAEAPDAAPALLRTEWRRLRGPLGEALAARGADPEAVVAALAVALPGAEALLALGEHPHGAVRAASAGRLAATGDPRALAAVERLAADPDPVVARAAAAALAGVRAQPPPRSFTLLGGFALRRGEWVVDARAWGRPTVARLVRFLLVHRPAAVPEERILEALWPDHDAERARAALRVAVSRARQVLDPRGAPGSAIRSADRTLRLLLDERDRVDAEVFAAAAQHALTTRGPDRPALLRAAVALWTGEPLPEELYADWAQEWRARLREVHVRLLADLARAERSLGDERAVGDAARALVALDPLDEDAHRTLITAYARTGRRALALRQFLACRRALVDGIGVEPDEQTAGLQAAILAGRPV